MFVCDECGRKFKTRQALGGHVSWAHPQSHDNDGKVDQQPVTESVPEHATEPQPQPTVSEEQLGAEDDEQGIMDTIREYRQQGLSARQIKSLGYNRKTVDDVFREYMKPENIPEDEHARHVEGMPVVIKGTESISPESIMQKLVNGGDDWHRRIEGMMLLRAAQRMNRDDIEMTRMQAEADAARMKPILELMKETRADQDAAAQRAKESNVEIAERAAYDAAGQLSQVINQNNTRIADSINQIRQAMGGKEEKSPLGQLLSTMQEMNQLMQMFGMRMPGQPGQQAPQGGDQGWQPPPIVRRSRHDKGGINV